MLSAPNQHIMALFLRKLESIATTSDDERQAIQNLPVRIHNLDARQDIVCDGDQPRHCALIINGWVCRYKLLSGGKRQILSFHIPGDIPDLMSLRIPTMDHSLATTTKVTVAFISHESLRELMACHPRIASVLWRETMIGVAVFREWLVSMGRRTAYEHVAHLFCELYLKLQAVGLAENHRCHLPIKQIDPADALGLTPVHVNRVLQEMRGKTLITLRSSTLVIQAWDELLRVAEFDPTYLQLEKRAAA